MIKSFIQKYKLQKDPNIKILAIKYYYDIIILSFGLLNTRELGEEGSSVCTDSLTKKNHPSRKTHKKHISKGLFN